MGQMCNGAHGFSSPRDAAPGARRMKRGSDVEPDKLMPLDADQVPKDHRVCNICFVCLPQWRMKEEGGAAEDRFAAAAPR
mmetsp:Transcript_58970/g.175445  ORF Transcript_58970/g.175445 Transcript_58970/m.175445 type:complete len:80 (-) Transcript_58970:102-341(-)